MSLTRVCAPLKAPLRGLPEGSCLYQYTRVMSGFDLPRQANYTNPITEVFASDRLDFLRQNAAFRRIDLHWCLTLEPSEAKAFERKPQENAIHTSRMLSDLEKTATILQSHLGSSLGLHLLDKTETFPVFQLSLQPRRVGRAGPASQRHRSGQADRERVRSHGTATTSRWANDTYRCSLSRRHLKRRGPAFSPACSLSTAIACCARHGG